MLVADEKPAIARTAVPANRGVGRRFLWPARLRSSPLAAFSSRKVYLSRNPRTTDHRLLFFCGPSGGEAACPPTAVWNCDHELRPSIARDNHKRMKFLLALALALPLGSQPTVPRPRLLGVAHYSIFVSDLSKARAFYEDFLGYQ